MPNDFSFLSTSSPSPSLEAVRVPPLDREYKLLDLWKVVSRRRRWIAGMVALALVLGLAYCQFSPRLYKAEAQLQLLKQDAASDLSDPAQAANSAAVDALDFNLAVQTHVDVLRSRNLALRVVQELHLDRTKEYQPRNDKAEDGRQLEQSPKRLSHVLTLFDKRLGVESVAGTRLISVTFKDRDPKRAALVVNQLLNDFIDYNYQVRFAASTQATSYLRNELSGMKAQVDSSQGNVVRLQQQSGIYGVDETNNAVNAKLEQLNAQLTTAEANRALKESVYHLALTRSPEVLAGMIGAQGTGANTVNAPLQLLRQQQADAAATYAELNARYGSEYPKVLQASQRLQSIQSSIAKEIDRLIGQATAEFKVATDTEEAASRALNAQKQTAAQMNHDSLLYTSAKHDADTSRGLYERLEGRVKEAGILSSLHSTNLNILDTATPPAKPAQSDLLVLLLALGAGLLAGLVGAFGAEAFDTVVRDPQKIELDLGFPVIGMLPPVETALPRAAVKALRKSVSTGTWQYETTARAPRSRVAESFRVLRTSLLLALGKTSAKVVAVTSTSEAEGKSFTVFNLASAFAQSGRSVLVVDADLRKRTLSEALDLRYHDGLDEALLGAPWRASVVPYVELPGLFIMPAGLQENSPADMLGSLAMQGLLAGLRENFDLVLVDTPSMVAVTDTLSLAGSMDAVIVVAKCGQTPEHSLARTLDMLRRAGAKVAGIVLNGIDFRSADFYYYWGKQGSGYDATTDQILAPMPPRLTSRPNRTPTIAAMLLLSFCSYHAVSQQLHHADGTEKHTMRLYGAASTTTLISPPSALPITLESPAMPQGTLYPTRGAGIAAVKITTTAEKQSAPLFLPASQPIRLRGAYEGEQLPYNTAQMREEAYASDPHTRDSHATPRSNGAKLLLVAQQVTSQQEAPTPSDIPSSAAAQKVVIGAGDLISISVYDAPELSQDVRVSANGKAHLTLLGDMQAVGLQPDGFASAIENQLHDKHLIQAPHVSVAIKEFTTQGVTVQGEVKKPGLYPIYAARSLVDVIAMADGTTSSADTRISIRRHGETKVEHVVLRQDDPDELTQHSIRVYPGDVITVPRAGLAYVLGDVTRPGGYIMHDNGQMTVLQAISEAQGTTHNASMKHVVLLRKASDGVQTIPLQLNEIMRGKMPDIALQNGDIVFVPTSGLKTFGQNTQGIVASVSGAALYSVAR